MNGGVRHRLPTTIPSRLRKRWLNNVPWCRSAPVPDVNWLSRAVRTGLTGEGVGRWGKSRGPWCGWRQRRKLIAARSITQERVRGEHSQVRLGATGSPIAGMQCGARAGLSLTGHAPFSSSGNMGWACESWSRSWTGWMRPPVASVIHDVLQDALGPLIERAEPLTPRTLAEAEARLDANGRNIWDDAPSKHGFGRAAPVAVGV